MGNPSASRQTVCLISHSVGLVVKMKSVKATLHLLYIVEMIINVLSIDSNGNILVTHVTHY